MQRCSGYKGDAMIGVLVGALEDVGAMRCWLSSVVVWVAGSSVYRRTAYSISCKRLFRRFQILGRRARTRREMAEGEGAWFLRVGV